VFLAACGGSSSAPDAAPADAVESSGSVTVIVTERGNPVSGLPVFFSSANGATTFSAVTSVSGSCGFDLADGFVTVHLPRLRYGVDQFTTFSGVKMTDVLHLDLEPRGNATVDVDVTIAPDPMAPGAPHYLYTSCEAEEPITIAAGEKRTLPLACPSSKLDMLVARVDPETNAPVRSQLRTNIDLDVSRDIQLNGAYSDVAIVNVEYPNLAPRVAVATTQALVSPRGRLYESYGGGQPATDTITIAKPVAAGHTTVLATHAFPIAGDFDEQVIYEINNTTNPLVVQMSTRLPAYANTGTAEAPIVGAFDAAAQKLVWSEGAGTRATFTRARVRFHRDDIPQGTAWTWQIVAARGAESAVQFPKLPALAFDFNPVATDVATIEELTNVLVPVGYDEVRTRGFADVNSFDLAAGSMVVQRRYIPQPE
jgi:hypothetical protein